MKKNNMTSLQFDKERKKRKKTYATFIISFLCFSVLLAAVSFLILLKSVNFKLSNLVDRKTTAAVEQSSSESETSVPDYSGKANILVACSASDKKLSFFTVLFFDMDEKQISVLPEEIDRQIELNGKTTDYSQVYSTGGAAGLLQAVEKQYGIKIDRFIDITESNFKKVISYLGDAVITSDEQINYRGDDYVLVLEKGEQSVTGETLLSYYKYLDVYGRCRLTARLIDYYIDSGKLSANQDDFDYIVNLVNTDISAKDFNDYSQTANAFFNDNGHRKKTVMFTKTPGE